MLVDNNIAWHQQADVLLVLKRLVGKRRIAGAENNVVVKLDVELFPEGLFDVDLGKYAKALLLKLFPDAFHGVLVSQIHLSFVSVCHTPPTAS